MPQFCDVALPVPVESVFTYRVPADGAAPVVGGRVLVPFRSAREMGVVTRLHDSPPSVECKAVLQVLDTEAALTPALLELGAWIAEYYIAPLGEVLRTMLPLGTELKRERLLRLTELGRERLSEMAERGSSLRAKKSPEEQDAELRVLDWLARLQEATESAILRKTKAQRATVDALLHKKWIAREDSSSVREHALTETVIALGEGAANARSTAQQQQVLEAVQQAGGRIRWDELRAQNVSHSAVQTLLKRGSLHKLEEKKDFSISGLRASSHADVALTAAQQHALAHIRGGMQRRKFEVALLHGVTGSGKTAVYLAAMQAALATGRGAILLVPEIGLTPAAAANLHHHFGSAVALLHSALSAAERAEQWRRIQSGEAKIAVGTRSAVFAPVHDLALLVVDEEHDGSYKQEETPRYHARDVAVMRGKLEDAMVVLGSATPSLESFYNTQQKKYQLLELRQRVEERPLPEVEVIDMRREFQETGEQRLFSRRLAEEVRERLQRGEQAMVLLNRRGYSSFVLCRACGESVQCKNCAIALTHHKRTHTLECHYCGHRQSVPRLCPKCASDQIFFLGAGSERLEERLSAEFPQARVGRLDRDTVQRREDFERVLARFQAGELDLLVGTQMIAKGHDVHGVTLVGVVGADFALGFPDFRAAERTFQLLTQVAGRAGRGATPGRVVLQTYFPDHYAIQFATQHDYAGFCEKELRFRRWMNYPPFTALANLLVRSERLEQALRFSGMLGEWFRARSSKGLRVLGPAAAPLARLKNEYRFHIILKSESRRQLNATLRAALKFCAEEKIPRKNLVVDIDPVSLL